MFGLKLIEESELERFNRAVEENGMLKFERSKNNEATSKAHSIYLDQCVEIKNLQLDNKVLKENDENQRRELIVYRKENEEWRNENEGLKADIHRLEAMNRTLEEYLERTQSLKKEQAENLLLRQKLAALEDTCYYEINMDTLTTDKVAYGDIKIENGFLVITKKGEDGDLLYMRKADDVVRVTLRESVDE